MFSFRQLGKTISRLNGFKRSFSKYNVKPLLTKEHSIMIKNAGVNETDFKYEFSKLYCETELEKAYLRYSIIEDENKYKYKEYEDNDEDNFDIDDIYIQHMWCINNIGFQDAPNMLWKLRRNIDINILSDMVVDMCYIMHTIVERDVPNNFDIYFGSGPHYFISINEGYYHCYRDTLYKEGFQLNTPYLIEKNIETWLNTIDNFDPKNEKFVKK